MCPTCVEQLRNKRNQWLDCLDSEDTNSIKSQLIRLTSNITAYRVLVEEVWQLAPDAKEGGKQFNGRLFRLILDCFSESLLMAFRRLMDTERLDGKRGVYSLRSLLDDMSQNCHLLTRGTLVAIGPPVDSQGANPDFAELWECSKNHLIDRLIGVSEAERPPTDRIPKAVFDERRTALEERFTAAETLINKAIAHAATPASRSGIEFEPISFEELYKFHAELCKTAHFLYRVISNKSLGSFLAEPLGEPFQYLTRPIVADPDVPRLAERWKELRQECFSWAQDLDFGTTPE